MRGARTTGALAVAAAFALFVSARGVPVLRHDWNWPPTVAAIGPYVTGLLSGWRLQGLGAPNPYPGLYVIALPIDALLRLFGPVGGLALLAFAIGFACAAAAAPLAERAVPVRTLLALELFATFNPWVYNKIVAGHWGMILAYAGMIGVASQLRRGREASSFAIALWLLLVEVQLQFMVVTMAVLLVFCLWRRAWLPLATGIVVSLPSIFGLIAERSVLNGIPYTLAWQADASLPALHALGLGGYAPAYGDRMGWIGTIAMVAAWAGALQALYVLRRERAAWIVAALAAFVYAVVLGVNGPLAVPYAWVVEHVHTSGLFRELYDLVAFLAIAFLLVVAFAGRRALPGALLLFSGFVLLFGWVRFPPSDLWVGGAQLSSAPVLPLPFSRVAFTPAFQPLASVSAGGSGADPDAYERPGPVDVLNQYLPSYPAAPALARWMRNGDASDLRALGVRQIVARPWLASVSHGTIGEAARSLARPGAQRRSAAFAEAMPLFSLCQPRQAALANAPGRCARFFADEPNVTSAALEPLSGSVKSVDVRAAWIDARLAFALEPELAQGIAPGALTTSRVPFALPAAGALLAYVQGSLVADDGRALATSRGSFGWITLPRGVRAVFCRGLCELVASAAAAPHLPLNVAPARPYPVAFSREAPWLYSVRLPAGANGVLRFDESYDAAWTAIANGVVLEHLRLDTAVNAWTVPAQGGSVTIVHWTSLLQCVAEAIGLLWVCGLLAAGARKAVRPI